MSIEYRIEAMQGFIRLDVSGTWTYGSEAREAKEVWRQVADACKEHGIERILAVFDIPGRFPTFAAFDIASDPESLGFNRCHKAALVYTYQERFESNLFSELVAVNRGFNVQAFMDESKAKNWLLRQTSSDQHVSLPATRLRDISLIT